MAMAAAFFSLGSVRAGQEPQKKYRIFVVSSYHRQYLWSQDTARGVAAGLADFGFVDTREEADEYLRNDLVETSRLIIKIAWMDSKRKSEKHGITDATLRIVKEINDFRPDIILLGDDNAANYIGNNFIDTPVPVVFWGINGVPLKYGLVDRLQQPGHNITGVYQSGYIKESLEYLKKFVPSLKTFAVLSDDSETGRARAKEIKKMAEKNELPLALVDTVITNSYSGWRRGALRIKAAADAIFLLNHNTLKDDTGDPVDQLTAGQWYFDAVRKPDCSDALQFAEEGCLLVVDDSGYKQGYEAMRMAHEILIEKKDPAFIPVIAPPRGKVVANRQRAQMLNLSLDGMGFIEGYIDKGLALQQEPK